MNQFNPLREVDAPDMTTKDEQETVGPDESRVAFR